MKQICLISLLFMIIAESGACNVNDTIYISQCLEIYQLDENTFIHKSYLHIRDSIWFPCNGLIVTSNGDALILDSPPEDSVATELISWVNDSIGHDIVGVVINHHHKDCLGGLAVFHEEGIPSYAHKLSGELAKADSLPLPLHYFEDSLTLRCGNLTVNNFYPGVAHSPDNIVSYIENSQVLFGGCMIKCLGAAKGNLADADVSKWALQVALVKERFPFINIVVPGHGPHGGPELLDYTIDLFSLKK